MMKPKKKTIENLESLVKFPILAIGGVLAIIVYLYVLLTELSWKNNDA